MWRACDGNPRELAEHFGFTGDEVRELCKAYKMSFEEARAWYDGYEIAFALVGFLVTVFIEKPGEGFFCFWLTDDIGVSSNWQT